MRARDRLGLGSDGEIAAGYRASRTIDAGGAILHPGFIDAHLHVSRYTARTALPLLARHGRTFAVASR